jgi:hypothetical protein
MRRDVLRGDHVRGAASVDRIDQVSGASWRVNQTKLKHSRKGCSRDHGTKVNATSKEQRLARQGNRISKQRQEAGEKGIIPSGAFEFSA